MLQARLDAYTRQAQGLMEDRGLSLDHKLNRGHSLPVELQMTAALLGLPLNTLPAARQAIHKVLMPKLVCLQQSLQASQVRCQKLQQGSSEPMLACLATYLEGQVNIVDINLRTLTASCQSESADS